MINKKLLLILIVSTFSVLRSSALVSTRTALEAYTPGEIALLRHFSTSAVMALFYCALPKRQPVAICDIAALFIMGITIIGTHNIALHYG